MSIETSIINGSLAVIAGDVLGLTVDRFVSIILDRFYPSIDKYISVHNKELVNLVTAIGLEVTMLTVGIRFMSNAFPWMTVDPAGFTLFMIGLSMNTSSLKSNVKLLNDNIFQILTKNPTEPVKIDS
jgi:hypothetical protein